MPKPEIYSSFSASWFQYLSLTIILLLSVLAVIKMRKMNDKQINRILIITSIILWVFEIYKQIIFSYGANWDYQWYAFPFQFCSAFLYVAPIIPFLKPGKVRNALIVFLATYSFFSGTAVIMFPSTVFITTTGINIQTMVHHGVLMIVGMGLLANYKTRKISDFFGSAIVFLVLLLIAVLLNTIHNNWIGDGTFNMFFINPKYENGIPILELVQPLVGPISFIIIYYLGFTMLAGIIFWIGTSITKKIPNHQREKFSYAK